MYIISVIVFFLFFKQKTAYEMRISDWSSDVCSSDLCRKPSRGGRQLALPTTGSMISPAMSSPTSSNNAVAASKSLYGSVSVRSASAFGTPGEVGTPKVSAPLPALTRNESPWPRSEEHTSELQSLMRISYDVFCLKKKQHKRQT